MVKSGSCIPNVTAWLWNIISTFIIPIFLDNFVENCLVCSSQFNVSSIYTPRNFVCLIWVIWWSFNKLFVTLGLHFFLLLQNMMKLVLDTFRERRFVENQPASFTSSEFTVVTRVSIFLCSINILVLSANNNSCNNLDTFMISFIQIRNKMWPSIEPCVTPHLIPNFADCQPL